MRQIGTCLSSFTVLEYSPVDPRRLESANFTDGYSDMDLGNKEYLQVELYSIFNPYAVYAVYKRMQIRQLSYFRFAI